MLFYQNLSKRGYLVKVFAIVVLLLSASSCLNSKKQGADNPVSFLKKVDSLIYVGQSDEVLAKLRKQKDSWSDDNPLLYAYYDLESEYSKDSPPIKDVFADKALSFFTTDKHRTEYPDLYFRALITKGDASVHLKKYINALQYYWRAKDVIRPNDCSNTRLYIQIASLYYEQKNFRLAAEEFSKSYQFNATCTIPYLPAKMFFEQAGIINSAGLAYEKAGMLDSARYFYLKNIAYINQATRNKTTSPDHILRARCVAYDNLGGSYLKTGNFAQAESYLLQSVTIPVRTIDGVKIPPMLKLAELYMQTGKLQQAGSYLDQSRKLINRYIRDNVALSILWHKLYAAYLQKTGNTAGAYQYQLQYDRLKDSVDNSRQNLYQLNINSELNSIQQDQFRDWLIHHNKTKKLFIIGSGIVTALCLVIMLMIYRNLQKTKRSHQNATQQNERLQVAMAELERVNQNYIRIMRVMAHDLRNPLGGITGLAAMLLDEDEFSEDSRHMLQLIQSTGTHTLEMINELLKTGLSQDQEPLEKQNLDLKALLFDSVELLRFKAQEKNQRILFNVDDDPIMVRINHEKIWRVFNNIIVNAIKFSHPGGDIRVNIVRRPGAVRIIVADDGIGIADSDKSNIFEMFTSAKRPGTHGEQPFGLGLSISKKIVEMHGGKIWFESKTGVGTIFYIELPN